MKLNETMTLATLSAIEKTRTLDNSKYQREADSVLHIPASHPKFKP